MFLPSPTPVPSMGWCLADYSTTLSTVSGLGSFFAMGGGEGREAGGEFSHVSVLLDEVVGFLSPTKGKSFIDGTLGGAGHAEALLRRGARVIGVDRDPDALAHAEERMEEFGASFESRRMNFSDLKTIGTDVANGVDGLLFDLGVSSYQFDSADRGFSLRFGGPLDMRMNPDEEFTAAELIGTWSEAELTRIFRDLGEERRAKAVAKAIVRRRERKPFTETLDLADCVASVVGRRGKIHPATRVFQAIRMTVNGELEALEAALHAAPDLLKPGGRLAVITFHSLEDRIVKRFIRARSAPEIDRPEWPEPRPNPEYCFRDLTRRPVQPSADEVARNPRARSAKLRVAEKITTE